MLHWFKKTDGAAQGIAKIKQDFILMLETARKEFHLAASVALCNMNVEEVKEEVLQYDKQVNRLERQIRKELVVHCAVKQLIDPESLVLMSIAKDAERLGDYSKNIFDLGAIQPVPPVGEDRDRLLILKSLIDALFEECATVFRTEDEEMAKKIICDSTWMAKQCDVNTDRLLLLEHPDRRTAPDALMYRFMKRVISHLRNICSSVVQPVHKLDFTSKITRDMDKSGDLLDRKEQVEDK